jgi:hypothetical protein
VGNILKRIRSTPAATTLILVASLAVACATRSDPAMIEVAKSLVPEGSEITTVTENTGPTWVNGQYSGLLEITDGGLGPGLLDAIEELASAGGWEERYRCEVLAGVTLGYSRDDLQVDVSVRTERDPVAGSVRIQRLGEGNPWPPEC